MKAIFIAGTDTSVGKSVVTGLLARHLSDSGYSVVTQKWVETGRKGLRGDVNTHLSFLGKYPAGLKSYMTSILPYSFSLAASPHIAARIDNKRISPARIKKEMSRLLKKFDFVIVEGTGGLLVPMNRAVLQIDIIKKFKLPLILVSANKLGAINHTLLALEALAGRKIKVLGIILNNVSKGQDPVVLEDNPDIIRRFTKIQFLGVLPNTKDKENLRRTFKPIGEKIISKWISG